MRDVRFYIFLSSPSVVKMNLRVTEGGRATINHKKGD